MKKIISISLLIGVMCALSSCGENSVNAASTEAKEVQESLLNDITKISDIPSTIVIDESKEVSEEAKANTLSRIEEVTEAESDIVIDNIIQEQIEDQIEMQEQIQQEQEQVDPKELVQSLVDEVLAEAAATAPEPIATTTGPYKTAGAVDVDLTEMSVTMIYANLYMMVTMPEEYLGKNIKMTGEFDVYESEDGEVYFAVAVTDEEACCRQGFALEFLDDSSYPNGFPDANSEITVVGRFEAMQHPDWSMTYYHLVDAYLVQ
ncbi:MAG: hypothetical protein R3Y53_09360 [Bacillota bacterium]